MLNAVLALNELDTVVFDSPALGGAPRIYDDFITVPDAHLLFNGEFKRVGSSDLKIVGEDGQSFFIADYFAAEKRAHLMSPEGATLSPRVVEALAGPLAPGQYAQAGAQPGTAQAVIGRCDALTGSATVVRNGVSVALNIGDTVRKGDVVQTAGGSSVAIVFADGTTFNLNANARMVLDDFIYNASGTGNSALVNLVQGTFSFVAGQVAKTGEMRVETPVATMGIRGTAVLVEISATDGQTKFSVMLEPNGTTGSFNLYNKTTGTLIATVNNSQVGWVVSPAGPLQVVAQQVQKTPGELAQELGIVQQIFTIFNNNQQNPFVPPQQDNQERRGDKPNDTNPQTAQGTGGSGPNVTFDVPITLPGNVIPTNVTVTITQILTNQGITLPNLPTLPTLPTIVIPTITIPTLNIINGTGTILGTAGADQIFGSDSDDIITAGAGDDLVFAEGGDDLVIAGEGEGNDFYDGGTAPHGDTIRYTSANGVVFNLNNGIWSLPGEADVKSSTAISAETGLDVFIRFEKIIGSPGNDTFILNDDAAWEIEAGAGNDLFILHTAGEVFIDAGAGIDTVRLAGGLDILDDQSGPDIINFEIVDLATDLQQNIVNFDVDGFDDVGTTPMRVLGGANDVIQLTNTMELNATFSKVGDNVLSDSVFTTDDETDGVLFDVYEVTVGEQTQLVYVQDGVQITLPGQNEAPEITTPPVVATVQEDGAISASGTIAATDADGDDVLSWSVVGGSTPADADYLFLMDRFNIIKNGGAFFTDEFDDGNAPPSVPAGSFPPSYAVNGTYFETGGRLVINSDGAGPATGVGTTDQFIGNFATLLTDINPGNLNLGLKNDDDFTVSGRFDLFNLPDSPRETYGIRLTDNLGPARLGDDTIELVVRKGLGGTVIIQLREIDFAADTVTTIDTIALNAPFLVDQIELRLSHSADNVGVIEASFDYLSNGEVVGTHTFANIGQIFGAETPAFSGDDENWTRAQIVTYAPATTDSYLAGAYGTLSVNQAGQWNYFLANNQTNVQQLAAGETVQDVFTVRVSDGHGGFDTQTITVNVAGTNDAPVITGGTDTGSVTEDAPANTVSGTLNRSDVDHGDTATWSIEAQQGQQQSGSATVQGAYGALTVNQNGQWTYTLDNGLPATQALGQNDHPVETFTVKVTDSHGATDIQTVQVTVHGAGEVNNAPAIVTADDDGSVGAGAPISTVGAGYLTADHDLVNGLGGDAGFGENLLGRNDDSSTPAIDITSVFGEQGLNFFGTNYTSFYINNNGNITFGGPLGTFTPTQIAGNNLKIIAPFWADVDTRGGDPNPGGTNLVYYDLDAANGVVTITWDDVGYFANNIDKLNAFQLQLIDRGDGNFDIVFRYEDVNWTTGGASGGTNGLGGTPARAGYTAGDGNSAHYFELAGSGNQTSMLDLENTAGNTGINGVHVFEVRAGSPTSVGTIEFSDADASDTHTVSSSFNILASDAGPALGTLTATLSRDTATGVNGLVTWNYVVTNSQGVANLPPGTTRTEVYDVVISDGHGGTVTQQVTITINGPDGDANQRPVLDEVATPAFTAVNEDAGAPVNGQAVGTLVSQLVDLNPPGGGLDNVTDSDTGALTGIAIYGVNATHGTLFYSTNNGATWSQVGSVSDSAALLLAADANTRLYFQPDPDFSGTVNDVITFRAWDQTGDTAGRNGEYFDIGIGGNNTTSVSSAPDTASININDVNASPQIIIDNAVTTGDDNATTLSGLTVSDVDAAEGEIFHATVVAQHGSLSMVNTEFDQADELPNDPQGMSFHASLDLIRQGLQDGVTYTNPEIHLPGQNDTEIVTLTVEDEHGGIDTINFIFNVFDTNSGVTLTGTSQKDMLFSTGYNDTLTGGDGRDVFVFGQDGDSVGHDVITDFVQGADRIALFGDDQDHDGDFDYDDLVTSGALSNLDPSKIFLSSGHSITLQNFNASNPVSDLTANDFIFHPATLQA